MARDKLRNRIGRIRLISVAVFMVCILSCAAAETFLGHSGTQNSGHIESMGVQKVADLEKMEKEREDGVIVFTVENYWKYVIQNPRPYDVVMLYNMNPSNQSRCPHCHEVQEEFK